MGADLPRQSVTQPLPDELRGYRTQTFTLYRLFSAEGDLIYLGVSRNHHFIRFRQHQQQSQWWDAVDYFTTETFSDYEQLTYAEWHAIQTEHPRHNRRRNSVPPRWAPDVLEHIRSGGTLS